MTRSEARENLMQMLFQMEAQNDFSSDAREVFMSSFVEDYDKAQLEYMFAVSDAFMNNRVEIDNLIENYSRGWKLARIAKVDLAALRLCIAESLYLSEDKKTPIGAAINEAVKLVKKFGSEDSGKFVNGILGQIARK